MFSVLGPVLVVTGLLDWTSLNIKTGGAMLVFGVVMLTLAIRRGRRSSGSSSR
jgi:hypothetical protein